MDGPSRFLTPLRTEALSDGVHERLISPLLFYSVERRGLFRVAAGFVTDFASVPRGFWNVFPRQGRWSAAAVLHDAAYRGCLQDRCRRRVTLIRPLADRLFLEAMRASGVNRVTAWLMYTAVRLFAGPVYHGLDHLQATPR